MMKPTKGRAVGVPNYKNELLINVVEAVLPNCAALWAIVAKRYQEASGDLILGILRTSGAIFKLTEVYVTMEEKSLAQQLLNRQ